jgi:hypothetical protein
MKRQPTEIKNTVDKVMEETRGLPCEKSGDEFEVLLCPEGVAIFSWNTPDIQELARLLGSPQFDEPRWCG